MYLSCYGGRNFTGHFSPIRALSGARVETHGELGSEARASRTCTDGHRHGSDTDDWVGGDFLAHATNCADTEIFVDSRRCGGSSGLIAFRHNTSIAGTHTNGRALRAIKPFTFGEK